MALLDVVKMPHEILRQKTSPVTKFDDELRELVANMIETMRASNGVGLAAPQVGLPYQLTVIETLPDYDDEGEEIPDSREVFVIANPRIVWTSREVVDGIEGCLSIPGYLGEVERHQAIRVRAQDAYGKKIKLKLAGWTARIFQHEIDHLNGILYIDRLTDPSHMWTEEEFERMQEAAALRAQEEKESAGETAVS